MDDINNRGPLGLDDAADDAGRALHGAADHARSRGQAMSEDAFEAAHDARDRVSEGARDLRGRAADAYGEARAWASGGRGGHGAVERFVTENPLLVGVVGVAAGLLLGALLPRTRSEDKAVGPWADEVRDQGFRYARDFTNRGREFVEAALDPETLNATAQRAAGDAGVGERPATHS